MISMSYTAITVRLFIAFLLGGVIGLERETHGRAAGLRTHILVCLGSALIMIVSALAFTFLVDLDFDPSRIAAQVVSGIGFLGAGTILREGSSIRGLTTAASLWVAAGIGLAVGAGLYFAAVLSTVFVLFSLKYLSLLEKGIARKAKHVLTVRFSDQPGQLGKIACVLGEMGLSIEEVDIEHQDSFISIVEIVIKPSNDRSKLDIAEAIRKLDGVYEVLFR
jgi:putative Mg2+ transporter-C (MgtC) family protein